MATIFNPATKGSRLHRTKMIGRRFGQIRLGRERSHQVARVWLVAQVGGFELINVASKIAPKTIREGSPHAATG
jgi:hypothetical protein